jgi:hypothetical protein
VDVEGAFTKLHCAMGQAADMCGMPGKSAGLGGPGPTNKPFFDIESSSFKEASASYRRPNREEEFET